ncbi:hypothetical protein BDDG_13591 [Blastomyces dermatitidis ATCC 18188]|uniref:Uncharacterized protein n=1 Tax=Ajellomyces dermatitidis (strain ATCC 18188 / CBS 674.68) TaxID=653446 RepID=A0A0J9HJR0_AJEDA|nr:hypothetical protein BDDG_13591 [Blastomyces dermatitidis ATCC 18188]
MEKVWCLGLFWLQKPRRAKSLILSFVSFFEGFCGSQGEMSTWMETCQP